MHSRMLTNVQGVQAKSEGAQLAEQRVEKPCCHTRSSAIAQAATDNVEVVAKFLGGSISPGLRTLVASAPQSLTHHEQQAAVGFGLWSARQFCRGLGYFALISLQPLAQLRRSIDLMSRNRQPPHQQRQLLDVMREHHGTRQIECLSRTLRRNERVAIAVAANPRPEAYANRKRNYV